MNEASLYIHIPFCLKKCAYCAFFSVCGASDAKMDAYFEALRKQTELLPPLRLQTVYFGGGTPTAAGERRLSLLLGAVAKRHIISSDAEITCEANPGTVEPDTLRRLRQSGFNRLSLGVQSADDGVLKALGRIHTADDAERAFSDARNAGFSNISLDMIFALPENFGDGLQKTTEMFKKLSPEHISAYSLSIEEGTRFWKDRSRLSLPDEDSEEAQYTYICSAFSGYEHYEISSFAKSGFRSRHNSAYWSMKPYIGIGAAAHSFWQNKRFSYPPDIDGFIRDSDKLFGGSDYQTAKPESQQELEEERVMLGLRTSDGAVISENQREKARIAISCGYASYRNGRLVLNERGYRVSNEIIAELSTP